MDAVAVKTNKFGGEQMKTITRHIHIMTKWRPLPGRGASGGVNAE